YHQRRHADQAEGRLQVSPSWRRDRQREDAPGLDLRDCRSVADPFGSGGSEVMRKAVLAIAVVLAASPAFAQPPGGPGKLTKAKETVDKVQGLHVSEADERKIGEEVSLKVRNEFGVFQDKDVTKYVTLVGSVLAQASIRPDLKWEFIVLDTDGVNAFA